MTLEILTSDDLTARHGFFTRKGGASTGIYQGLNCGLGSNDAREAVLANRANVANALQVDHDALQSVHQIHSANVVTLTSPADRNAIKADAMVTDLYVDMLSFGKGGEDLYLRTSELKTMFLMYEEED